VCVPATLFHVLSCSTGQTEAGHKAVVAATVMTVTPELALRNANTYPASQTVKQITFMQCNASPE
ncbi:hypothetical protein COCMIDRAFT_100910, partial [Bipolaris oryzae ATCC 44560]